MTAPGYGDESVRSESARPAVTRGYGRSTRGVPRGSSVHNPALQLQAQPSVGVAPSVSAAFLAAVFFAGSRSPGIAFAAATFRAGAAFLVAAFLVAAFLVAA